MIPLALDPRGTIADLKEHLLELHREFSKEDLPGIKKVEEIEVE